MGHIFQFLSYPIQPSFFGFTNGTPLLGGATLPSMLLGSIDDLCLDISERLRDEIGHGVE